MRKLLRKRYLVIIIAVLAIALPLLIFAPTQQQSLRQYAAATTHRVSIQNFTMNPTNLTVTVGDTVTWTNLDEIPHDAHATQEEFRSPLLKKGDTWSFTFTKPGTYEYFCTPHKDSMNGYTITVLGTDDSNEAQVPSDPTPTVQLPTPQSQATIPPLSSVPQISELPQSSGAEDGTSVAVTLQLHGIGQAGDTVNPGNSSMSNKTPKEPERIVSLMIFDSSGQQVLEPSGTLRYNQSTGDFQGTISLGSNFTPGKYTIKARMKKYLVKKLAENFDIGSGKHTLPVAALIVGDMDANNMLDAQDYNAIVGCFTEEIKVKKCDEQTQLKADLNDDGAINILDTNLLQRELIAPKGD